MKETSEMNNVESFQKLLQEGTKAAESGDYDTAVEQFTQATESDPSNAKGWYNLALAQQYNQQGQEAIISYLQAISCDDAPIEAYLNLGNLYGEHQMHEQAVEIFQSGLEHDNTNPAIFTALGNTYFEMHYYDDSIQAYRQALVVDPDNEDAADRLAIVRQRVSHQVHHIQELEKHIDAVPDDISRYGEVVGAYIEARKFQDALSTCNQMVAIEPENRAVYAALAAVYEALEDHDQTMAMWEKVTQLDPESYEAWERLGTWRSEQGLVEEAVEAFEKALEINPENPEIYFALADTYVEAGRFDDTIYVYTALIEERPYKEDGDAVSLNEEEIKAAYSGLVETCNSAERYQEAEEKARYIIEELEEDANVYYQLATAIDAQGRSEEAVEFYLRSIELDPLSPIVRNDLADTYLGLGKYDDALEQVDTALLLDQNLKLGYETKAQALAVMGRNEESTRVYQEMVRRFPA